MTGDATPGDTHSACPAVSVVMSARNEAPYVDAAVASVLAQRFADFELVIRDDGSTDDTGDRLAAWAARDARIRLCRADQSLGLAGCGNFVVAQARAPLIARMDADDIADPDWLGKLHATIVDRADVVLVGCLWSGIDIAGRAVRVADRWRASRASIFPPFAHGSSIFRRAAFDAVGGYRADCAFWEDFDLVLRLARQGTILFLPDDLYRYRFASTSTRLVSDQRQVERAVDRMFACAAAYRATGDYEAVLAAPMPLAAPTPRTLVSLSSNRLWNGVRPGKWRRVVDGVRWPPTRETLISLAVATWSDVSPRTLRAALATLIRVRAARSPVRAGAAPLVWDPRAAMVPAARADAAVAGSFALVAAACIPSGAPGRAAALPRAAAGPIDPRALVRLTRWHRVAPFVQIAVAEAGIALPADVARDLAAQSRQARLQALANAAEEARLATAARRQGVDLLFVKGATLAHLVHRDPAAKSAWDIDVLIAPADLPAACALLEAEGYAIDLPAGVVDGPRRDRWLAGVRESLWRNTRRGTAVELHTGLCESGGMIPGVGMTSPRQSVAVARVAIPTLAEAELFAFLTVHGLTHGWARLKWLADVAALIEASPRSVEDLHAAAVALGAGRCPGVALLLCARVFGLALPQALSRTLAADPVTMKLVAHSWAAMDRVGDPTRRLSARTLREIVTAMRVQYWLAPGMGYRLRTFWSQWTRPYAPSQLAVPAALLPVAMIAWLPARLLLRRWRRA